MIRMKEKENTPNVSILNEYNEFELMDQKWRLKLKFSPNDKKVI